MSVPYRGTKAADPQTSTSADADVKPQATGLAMIAEVDCPAS